MKKAPVLICWSMATLVLAARPHEGAAFKKGLKLIHKANTTQTRPINHNANQLLFQVKRLEKNNSAEKFDVSQAEAVFRGAKVSVNDEALQSTFGRYWPLVKKRVENGEIVRFTKVGGEGRPVSYYFEVDRPNSLNGLLGMLMFKSPPAPVALHVNHIKSIK